MSALSTPYLAFVSALREALEDSPLRVLDDLGASVERSNVVVGPPTLTWSGQCGTLPDTMQLQVYLVEDVSERATERLLEQLPALLAALDTPDVSVTGCIPAAFPSGTSDLPAYQITAETTL